MPVRFAFLILIFSSWSCAMMKNGQSDQTIRVAFYNVENLFDLEDDPNTLDEDFTPSGKQQWTAERYQTKLNHIDEVAKGLGYPVLLGLCEVENKKVLEDLSETGGMRNHPYHIAHFESPDRRGIDVALLYNKKHFKVKSTSFIRMDFPEAVVPDEAGYTSRDILVVEGALGSKSTVYVMVVHFPSRYGGVPQSEPKRVHVASFLRNKIDELQAANPNASFIIMGDFNDETTNKSVAQTLQAFPLSSDPKPEHLYNCFSKLDADSLGSYNYRGEWNMLDQIILSGRFFLPTYHLEYQSSHIFREEFLMYNDPKNGPRPNRTYGGDRYFGGYSDHLPVYIDLKKVR